MNIFYLPNQIQNIYTTASQPPLSSNLSVEDNTVGMGQLPVIVFAIFPDISLIVINMFYVLYHDTDIWKIFHRIYLIGKTLYLSSHREYLKSIHHYYYLIWLSFSEDIIKKQNGN